MLRRELLSSIIGGLASAVLAPFGFKKSAVSESSSVVFYHRQSGKYIPVGRPIIRAFVTCRPRDYEGKRLGYPRKREKPNTYAIVQFDCSVKRSHAHNLYEGEDSYIPEGTLIWAWLQNSQWFTYYRNPKGLNDAQT